MPAEYAMVVYPRGVRPVISYNSYIYGKSAWRSKGRVIMSTSWGIILSWKPRAGPAKTREIAPSRWCGGAKIRIKGFDIQYHQCKVAEPRPPPSPSPFVLLMAYMIAVQYPTPCPVIRDMHAVSYAEPELSASPYTPHCHWLLALSHQPANLRPIKNMFVSVV